MQELEDMAMRSVLDGLDLDIAIRLRWVLRDIKAGRTKFFPVSGSDRMALIELSLIEMRDNVPQLTNAGHRAISAGSVEDVASLAEQESRQATPTERLGLCGNPRLPQPG